MMGRRYCTLDDRDTGKRRVQLHCFARGDAHIERHLAFRDYLRVHPAIAREYEMVKIHARDLYPNDSSAYAEEKSTWVNTIELAALEWIRSQASLRTSNPGRENRR